MPREDHSKSRTGDNGQPEYESPSNLQTTVEYPSESTTYSSHTYSSHTTNYPGPETAQYAPQSISNTRQDDAYGKTPQPDTGYGNSKYTSKNSGYDEYSSQPEGYKFQTYPKASARHNAGYNSQAHSRNHYGQSTSYSQTAGNSQTSGYGQEPSYWMNPSFGQTPSYGQSTSYSQNAPYAQNTGYNAQTYAQSASFPSYNTQSEPPRSEPSRSVTVPPPNAPPFKPLPPQNLDLTQSLTEEFSRATLSDSGQQQQEDANGLDGVEDEILKPRNQLGPGGMFSHRNISIKRTLMDSYIAKIKSSSFFKLGRVVKVLWSEPMGETATSHNVNKPRGGTAYTKIRRFVVIRKGKGYSICLPIFTYSNQGTMKFGGSADEHVAIITGNVSHHPGEKLTKPAIHVRAALPSEKLDGMSRVNYTKTYTIEHNVKVVDVGMVRPDDFTRLNKYFVDFIMGGEIEPELM